MRKKNKFNNKKAIGTGLAIILLILLWGVVSHDNADIAMLSAIAVLVVLMVYPRAFRFLYPLWFGLSNIMGNVISKILLTVLFFLMVVPVGAVRKMLGKDSMRTGEWKKSEESVFCIREETFCKQDLKTPY